MFVGIGLAFVIGEVAAQAARPLPPVLAVDGEPLPQAPARTNEPPARGVARHNILFSEDWERQPAGVRTSNFTNWTRAGAGAGQGCSVTEIIANGGPKGGKAYRAFLEDSGTCGRAEIRLQDPVVDKLMATHVGPPPVPTIANGTFADHFVFQSLQPATCTSCQPDAIGFMFAMRVDELPSNGDKGTFWQHHTGGYDGLLADRYHTSANPVFGLQISESRIAILIRKNESLGGRGQNPTVVTPADLGVSDWTGETLEIYAIVRYDTRTDEQGGDGRYELYIELEGNKPTKPRFVWDGQTIHSGLYRYKKNGEGPVIGDPSTGIYHDAWRNNGKASDNRWELVFDNYMWVSSPKIAEMYQTMQLSNFSSLR